MRYLSWSLSLAIALMLLSVPSARAAEATIEVVGDNWNASTEDIRRVLVSASQPLLVHFPDRKLGVIQVSYAAGVPITLFRKGPDGQIQVHLSARGTYWAQYTYQFAHELTHVLSNYDRQRPRQGRHQWFDEALCETGSLYVLAHMKSSWEKAPPYPNWKSFAPAFDSYLNNMLADRTRRLPPDQAMPAWLKRHLPDLERQKHATVDSRLVAVYLLDIFRDHPGGWEALNWYNLDDDASRMTFEQFLRAWHARVPVEHREVTRAMLKLFGYAAP